MVVLVQLKRFYREYVSLVYGVQACGKCVSYMHMPWSRNMIGSSLYTFLVVCRQFPNEGGRNSPYCSVGGGKTLIHRLMTVAVAETEAVAATSAAIMFTCNP